MKAWRRGEAAMRKSTEHHSEPPPKEIKINKQMNETRNGKEREKAENKK